ncbi:MAG: cyanophycinase [Bacillota bacterium]|nr:cyanophycinase [Bacillota bacterium]MDK2881844.1 cyanophycinase [Bacillota bacterium]MDK2960129.1 cyanophycinase [Bacillota bacterium]
MSEKVKGNLVIVGGAEDKEGSCVILRRFLSLAGGEKARIAVLTTATEKAEEVGSEYTRLFYRLGAAEVRHLDVADREAARAEAMVDSLSRATGIFLTGGDQLRLTSILGGTPLAGALHAAVCRGAVLAGTSAGASAMSATMIVEGRDESAPRRSIIAMAPGLGFLKEVVVDQHFAERGRIGRLLAAIAENPYILGLGLDEDTAIVCEPGGSFTVIGSGACTVVDGVGIRMSNISESAPGEPLVLTYVTLHILPAGYTYDLKRRRPGVAPFEEDEVT